MSVSLPATRVTRASRRFVASTLVAALMLSSLAPAGHAQVRLPALGEGAAEDFSAGTERKIGEQIMRDVWRDPDYLDDPVLGEYLQALWRPLVAAARARGDIEGDVDTQFSWDAFLVRDRSVNAFALPGGWVGVHLGLIGITASSEELASVLAHELAHVTQRHIARGVVNSQRQSLIGLAGTILAVLAASRSNNADAVQAAVVGGQAAAIQGQLNFSRDMEREADRVGYAVLQQAGFAPAGMAAMFEKLDTANRLNDTGAFPYLRSHPLTTERMSEARSRNMLSGTTAPAASLVHAMMQARSKVLMDPAVQSLRRFQEPLAATSNTGRSPAALRERVHQLYAGALASSLLRDNGLADAALREAQTLVAAAMPQDPRAERLVQLLKAHVLLARGDAAGSLAALNTLTLDPATRAPLLMRAQAAVALHRQGGGGSVDAELRASTEALQTWVADHRRDSTAWAALSGTAEAIGLRLRSLRANAEARAADGDLNGAIDRFRAAQSAARGTVQGQDFIEASIIDARLRDLMGQRRQLALEMMRNSRSGRGGPDPDRPEGEQGGREAPPPKELSLSHTP